MIFDQQAAGEKGKMLSQRVRIRKTFEKLHSELLTLTKHIDGYYKLSINLSDSLKLRK
jgi:hypothetical protein